jgi:hypothetical protein
MGNGSTGQPGRDLCFWDWSRKLQADASLTPGLREGYRRTIEGFLRFCEQRRSGPTVALAREYVEPARLERAPSPSRLQQWKDALKWWFRRGGEALGSALKGVPPLARSHLWARPIGSSP